MIINTNPGAAMAARILGESSSALQKSLSRLSSGSRSGEDTSETQAPSEPVSRLLPGKKKNKQQTKLELKDQNKE